MKKVNQRRQRDTRMSNRRKLNVLPGEERSNAETSTNFPTEMTLGEQKGTTLAKWQSFSDECSIQKRKRINARVFCLGLVGICGGGLENGRKDVLGCK